MWCFLEKMPYFDKDKAPKIVYTADKYDGL